MFSKRYYFKLCSGKYFTKKERKNNILLNNRQKLAIHCQFTTNKNVKKAKISYFSPKKQVVAKCGSQRRFSPNHIVGSIYMLTARTISRMCNLPHVSSQITSVRILWVK